MFLTDKDGKECGWKPMDAAVADGKIVMLRETASGNAPGKMPGKVPEKLAETEGIAAAQVIDASGCYVTPGLIDLPPGRK